LSNVDTVAFALTQVIERKIFHFLKNIFELHHKVFKKRLGQFYDISKRNALSTNNLIANEMTSSRWLEFDKMEHLVKQTYVMRSLFNKMCNII
jgi:hypothetical protein